MKTDLLMIPYYIEEDGSYNSYLSYDKTEQFLINFDKRVNKEIGKNSTEEARIDIKLHLMGGDWECTKIIYNAIKYCPVKTRIYLVGSAYSSGSVIFQAATERIVYLNSTIGIHFPMESYIDVPSNSYKSLLEHEEKQNDWMINVFVERMAASEKYKGMKTEDIKTNLLESMYKNVWFIKVGKEIVNEGLADKIIYY